MSVMIADTKYGKVEGIAEKGYTVFKGIPYAAAPVGNLRWKAPVQPDEIEGVLMADKFQNRCMQFPFNKEDFYYKEFYNNPDFVPEMSEDSLYLNIWTPAETSEEKLPVAFWIHGGAFMHGFGSELEFDGKEYCDRGVILVSINYRVGALGFLAHDWLSQENKEGISGNYGILDQIAALKWVRENIGAFGGDKDKITVFGQSAGSMSVQTLISSPITNGMIAGAIMQSGGGYKGGYSRDMTVEEAKKTGRLFVEATGANSLTELRALSAEEIIKATEKMMRGASGMGLPFVPIIDGSLLLLGYDETIEKGLNHNINYMLGCTSEDLSFEPGKTGKENPLYSACKNFSVQNEKSNGRPAYVYYFSHQPKGDDAGAFHSSELWYTFGTLSRSWRPKDEADYELSKQMLNCWAEFMKTGRPEEYWRPCSKNDKFVMEFR